MGRRYNRGEALSHIIYTLRRAPEVEKKRLLEILDMHMRDIELIKEAVAIMERYRAIEYAKEVTRRLVEEAWAEVDRWLRPSQAKETLRALAQFLIERSY